MRCSVPKRSPVRTMAERIFCASMVPSKDITPSMQRSQLPHGSVRLAEIGEQRLAAAARRFAKRHQRVEALALDALLLVGRVALLDLQAAQAHVVEAVERQRIGGRAVAAGAADLLVIGLDGFRQRRMGDEAHVGLVDAHAEGDGRHHHHAVLLQEDVLVLGAVVPDAMPAW